MIPTLIKVYQKELPKPQKTWLSLNTNQLHEDVRFIPYEGQKANSVLQFVMVVFFILSLLTTIPAIYAWMCMLIGAEYDDASVTLLPALAIPFWIIAVNHYKEYQKLEREHKIVQKGICRNGVFYDQDTLLIVDQELHTLISKEIVQHIDEKLTKNYKRHITITIQEEEKESRKISLPLTSRKEMVIALQNWAKKESLKVN